MTEIPNVRLSLSNRPENVLVVHQAVVGLAENIGLDALETNDLDTAVTEVCNNVVYHAYEGEEGPLEVAVYVFTGAVDVVVRDRGLGIRPHVGERRTQPHTGIGLPIVHALTQCVAFSKLAGGGTEVRMQFSVPNATGPELLDADGLESQVTAKAASTSTIELALAPNTVARAVLPRVLSVLAERACFSADRVRDVRLVADALAANARDSIAGSQLSVAVSLAPHSLDLRVGPLPSGCARRLLDPTIDGVGAVIERLTEDHRVTSSESAELLGLRLVDRP